MREILTLIRHRKTQTKALTNTDKNLEKQCSSVPLVSVCQCAIKNYEDAKRYQKFKK